MTFVLLSAPIAPIPVPLLPFLLPLDFLQVILGQNLYFGSPALEWLVHRIYLEKLVDWLFRCGVELVHRADHRFGWVETFLGTQVALLSH